MARKDDYARASNDGVTVHDDLTGRETDGHPQYVHTEIAREITVQHTFNPFHVSPFLVGEDSSGYLVTGLNADLLDSLHAAAFALVSHNHIKAHITDLEPISATPTVNTIPLADASNKIALGWLLTGTGNGLDADMLDGHHAVDFALVAATTSFNVAAVLGTL